MSPVKIISIVLVCGSSVYAQGTEMRWQPSSPGYYVDNHQGEPGVPSEIFIDGIIVDSVVVTLELDLSDWGDAAGFPSLVTYAGTIDAVNGYVSGGNGVFDGTLGENDDLGPFGVCDYLSADGCFVDRLHPRYVFRNVPPSCLPVDPNPVGCPNCEIGDYVLGGCSAVDPGTIEYGGTVLVEVPQGAYGTYEIPFDESPGATLMRDTEALPILPLTATSALITVPTGRCCSNVGSPTPTCADGITETMCAQNPPVRWFVPGEVCAETCPCFVCLGPECNDADACTDDFCDFVETCACAHQPNYDVDTECCDPLTGNTVPLDDGIECTADICHPDGSVEHILMDGIPCEHPDPCVIEDHCESGVCVGTLPGDWPDGVIICLSDDDCPPDWSCNSITEWCDCWNPLEVRMNRYLMFMPDQDGPSLAYHLTMTASTYFPTSTGPVGWIGQPYDASCVDDQGNPLPGAPPCVEEFASRLVDQPFFTESWPRVLWVADCPIVPAASYEVRSSVDGVSFGDPIMVQTIAQPDKWWGDVVGAKAGDRWSPPDGAVNFDDIQAVVQAFERTAGAPHWTWVDLDGEIPNALINMTDVQMAILAFEGGPYSFAGPTGCP